MLEVGVVIGSEHEAIYWHEPSDRSSVALPDSDTLWDVIWRNRKTLLGVAHSHPGSDWPGPSHEDVTTFSAIERALGRRLRWWITSSDRLIECRWRGPGLYDYEEIQLDEPVILVLQPAGVTARSQYNWLRELRSRTYNKKENDHDHGNSESPGPGERDVGR